MERFLFHLVLILTNMTKFVYISRYSTKGQILWERNGFFKITFTNESNKVITEIFLKEEFDFIDSL
jgi:hypothetical protein